MKKITYNPANSLSILLAAALLYRNNGLVVEVTDKNGTDFLEKWKKEYPEENLETNYAVQLLTDENLINSENKRGKAFDRGLKSLYFDIVNEKGEMNFQTVSTLNQIFYGDRTVIRSVIEAGGILEKSDGSPAVKSDEDASASGIQDEKAITEPVEFVNEDIDELQNNSRGDFFWKDDEKTDVLFKPNPNGKWFVSLVKGDDPKGDNHLEPKDL